MPKESSFFEELDHSALRWKATVYGPTIKELLDPEKYVFSRRIIVRIVLSGLFKYKLVT